MPASLVTSLINDGNDNGWPIALAEMWGHPERRAKLLKMIDDLNLNVGIEEPILVGLNGSLVDGYYRLAVALAFNIDIPVQFTLDPKDHAQWADMSFG